MFEYFILKDFFLQNVLLIYLQSILNIFNLISIKIIINSSINGENDLRKKTFGKNKMREALFFVLHCYVTENQFVRQRAPIDFTIIPLCTITNIKVNYGCLHYYYYYFFKSTKVQSCKESQNFRCIWQYFIFKIKGLSVIFIIKIILEVNT